MNYPVAFVREQRVVAVMRDSKQVAVPMSSVHPVGPKGDPGGNIMAIGLFEDAHSLTIASGTDVVRTSGYAVIGKGIADYFADAAVDAAYVTAHPRTSFISANSRGFRLDASKGIDLFQVGGVADCPAPGTGTDNYAAFTAAIAALGRGGTLIIPDGGDYFFRSTTTVVFTAGIRIIGHGWHENSGLVDGVGYSPPRNYSGSVIAFDSNTAGFRFIGATDNNADSIVNEFHAATYSPIENIMLLGGGGTSTDAHGLETRVSLFLRNVRVHGFAGNGLLFNAYHAGAVPYGNADLTTAVGVHADANGCHGWLIRGSDSNVITFLGCKGFGNGGAGFLDTGFLGNQYLGCQAAGNNTSHGTVGAQRTYVTSTTGGSQEQTGFAGLSDAYVGSFLMTQVAAAHTYFGCYSETGLGTKRALMRPAQIIGGNLSATADYNDGSGSVFQATVINGYQLFGIDDFNGNGSGFNFHGDIKVNGVKVLSDRQAAVPLPTGGATVDAEARTAIGLIIARLQNHGSIS